MSCKNTVLNEDSDPVCECGDEGRQCDNCAAEQAEYWRGQWSIAPLSERDPEAYQKQMRDAGRGHLLKR